MNGYAPEKSADLIVFIHFYVLLGTNRHQKEAISAIWLLTAITEYWTGMLRNMYGNHSPSVVYLLIPTSNHNSRRSPVFHCQLYIFWFLHQTTTLNVPGAFRYVLYIFWFLHQTTTLGQYKSVVPWLYIFWFLHQTTTNSREQRMRTRLYIFWFLHQTTTILLIMFPMMSCISFDSYIKPQPYRGRGYLGLVVYLLIPTSNHNR